MRRPDRRPAWLTRAAEFACSDLVFRLGLFVAALLLGTLASLYLHG